jgi:hypothetical protein
MINHLFLKWFMQPSQFKDGAVKTLFTNTFTIPTYIKYWTSDNVCISFAFYDEPSLAMA